MEAIDEIRQMIEFVRSQARYFRTLTGDREVMAGYLCTRALLGMMFSAVSVLVLIGIDVIFGVLLIELVIFPTAMAMLGMFIILTVLSFLICMLVSE